MKRVFINNLKKNSYSMLLLASVIALSSCSRDKDIKGAIRVKAKDNLYFAGVQYAVHNSIVTLKGKCPTPESIGKVVEEVKDINAVDSVVNQITLGTVYIDSSLALKQKVDSLLAKYPAVTAEVTPNTVRLMGTLPRKSSPQVFATVKGLLNAELSASAHLSNYNSQ